MKTLFTTVMMLVGLQAFCQYEAIKPQGIYSSQFVIDDVPRNITYYMPAGYGKNDTALYALIIFLHEDNSSAKKTITKYGDIIHGKADAGNCVVMYPDAINGHWNSKPNLALKKDSINDVAFVSIMLDFFIKQYHCDPAKVYLAGIGNGGSMCYRINCESPYNIRAIKTINAVVPSGSLQSCRPKQAIPATNITGEASIQAALSKALEMAGSN